MVLEASWHECILVVTQDGLELFHCGDGVHGGAFVPVTVKLILPFAAPGPDDIDKPFIYKECNIQNYKNCYTQYEFTNYFSFYRQNIF